jgi:hypothetical protein
MASLKIIPNIQRTPILHKLLQNIKQHRILPNTFYEASITLTSKSDKNYKPTSLMNTDVKTHLHKILASILKGSSIIVRFIIPGIQGWVSICK